MGNNEKEGGETNFFNEMRGLDKRVFSGENLLPAPKDLETISAKEARQFINEAEDFLLRERDRKDDKELPFRDEIDELIMKLNKAKEHPEEKKKAEELLQCLKKQYPE